MPVSNVNISETFTPLHPTATTYKKNSLFVVIDPWLDVDLDRIPWLNEYNAVISKKIIHYTVNLKHKCVSISLSERLDPRYDKWNNLCDKTKMIKYMNTHNLDCIVYAGFHHGRCIIDRATGARQMSKLYKCYLKHDLVCLYPAGPEDSWRTADLRSKQYLEFI